MEGTHVSQLLSEYQESHRNKINKRIHCTCVPIILFTAVGLLWSIPTPELFHRFIFPVNFGTLFLLFAMLYYLRLSMRLTLGMIFVGVIVVIGNYYLAKITSPPLWLSSLIVFSIAWVGQFIGHGIEGKKPSFLKDLQFLLIGPLWVLSFIYKKFDISY